MRFNDFIVEHNVYNQDKLEEWLGGFTYDLTTDVGKAWFLKTLKKQIVNAEKPEQWLDVMKELPGGAPDWAAQAIQRGDLYAFNPRKVSEEIQNDLSHIADYILHLEGTNPIELNKINRQSFEVMDTKAKQWTETMNRQVMKLEKQRLKDTGVSEEPGVEIAMKWKDGYFIVDLRTQDACGREGALTGHCVASYGGRVESGATRIFSLRNPQNKPLVTLEIRDNEIWQIKGHFNKPPGPETLPYLKDFVLANQYDIRGDYKNLGLIKLGDRLWDPEKEMPDVVNGNLFLTNFPGKLNFPDVFVVKGNLYLEGSNNIIKFPKDLKVRDDMDVENTNLKHLPDKLIVGGSLHIANTTITMLPEGLSVGEDLNAANTKFARLPLNFTIGGGIDLENSALEHLPVMHIPDFLDVSGTKIDSIPKGTLQIDGNFYIAGTKLSRKEVLNAKNIIIGGDVED